MWSKVRGKYLIREVDRRSVTGDEMLLSLSKDRGIVPRSDLGFDGEGRADSLVGYKCVNPGVIIMNKMQAWNGMFGLSTLSGVVSPEYTTLVPLSTTDPRFLVYLLKSDFYVGEFSWRSRGMGTAFLRLHPENLLDTPFLVPDVEMQRAIADYLDRETARIDALITKKQRMIELFKERRQALITSAVTGETTSRGGGVSGRLKSLASLIVDLRDNGALPCIALEHLAGGTGALEPGVWLPIRDGGESGFSAVLPGDVLFGKLRPYLAKTLLIREPAYASTELLALRPSQSVDARYFAYLIGSRPIIEWATASSDGTKMPRTSWEKLGEFRLSALPDLDIQRSIADYLDRETARIDAITVPLVQQIDLLRERRQALITAAVTGELEIPGVAA
jgi:type I restriction enzyme S subunit